LRVPAPGQAKKVALLGSLDHAVRELVVHTSKLALAALAARAHWLTVEWLPKYAPELNDIEPVWRDLKAHHLAHQTFADADALDQAIQAVDALNDERMAPPSAKLRISAQLDEAACSGYAPLSPLAVLNDDVPPLARHYLHGTESPNPIRDSGSRGVASSIQRINGARQGFCRTTPASERSYARHTLGREKVLECTGCGRAPRGMGC
jgi:hypothetical protein